MCALQQEVCNLQLALEQLQNSREVRTARITVPPPPAQGYLGSSNSSSFNSIPAAPAAALEREGHQRQSGWVKGAEPPCRAGPGQQQLRQQQLPGGYRESQDCVRLHEQEGWTGSLAGNVVSDDKGQRRVRGQWQGGRQRQQRDGSVWDGEGGVSGAEGANASAEATAARSLVCAGPGDGAGSRRRRLLQHGSDAGSSGLAGSQETGPVAKAVGEEGGGVTTGQQLGGGGGGVEEGRKQGRPQNAPAASAAATCPLLPWLQGPSVGQVPASSSSRDDSEEEEQESGVEGEEGGSTPCSSKVKRSSSGSSSRSQQEEEEEDVEWDFSSTSTSPLPEECSGGLKALDASGSQQRLCWEPSGSSSRASWGLPRQGVGKGTPSRPQERVASWEGHWVAPGKQGHGREAAAGEDGQQQQQGAAGEAAAPGGQDGKLGLGAVQQHGREEMGDASTGRREVRVAAPVEAAPSGERAAKGDAGEGGASESQKGPALQSRCRKPDGVAAASGEQSTGKVQRHLWACSSDSSSSSSSSGSCDDDEHIVMGSLPKAAGLEATSGSDECGSVEGEVITRGFGSVFVATNSLAADDSEAAAAASGSDRRGSGKGSSRSNAVASSRQQQQLLGGIDEHSVMLEEQVLVGGATDRVAATGGGPMSAATAKTAAAAAAYAGQQQDLDRQQQQGRPPAAPQAAASSSCSSWPGLMVSNNGNNSPGLLSNALAPPSGGKPSPYRRPVLRMRARPRAAPQQLSSSFDSATTLPFGAQAAVTAARNSHGEEVRLGSKDNSVLWCSEHGSWQGGVGAAVAVAAGLGNAGNAAPVAAAARGEAVGGGVGIAGGGSSSMASCSVESMGSSICSRSRKVGLPGPGPSAAAAAVAGAGAAGGGSSSNSSSQSCTRQSSQSSLQSDDNCGVAGKGTDAKISNTTIANANGDANSRSRSLEGAIAARVQSTTCHERSGGDRTGALVEDQGLMQHQHDQQGRQQHPQQQHQQQFYEVERGGMVEGVERMSLASSSAYTCATGLTHESSIAAMDLVPPALSSHRGSFDMLATPLNSSRSSRSQPAPHQQQQQQHEGAKGLEHQHAAAAAAVQRPPQVPRLSLGQLASHGGASAVRGGPAGVAVSGGHKGGHVAATHGASVGVVGSGGHLGATHGASEVGKAIGAGSAAAGAAIPVSPSQVLAAGPLTSARAGGGGSAAGGATVAGHVPGPLASGRTRQADAAGLVGIPPLAPGFRPGSSGAYGNKALSAPPSTTPSPRMFQGRVLNPAPAPSSSASAAKVAAAPSVALEASAGSSGLASVPSAAAPLSAPASAFWGSVAEGSAGPSSNPASGRSSRGNTAQRPATAGSSLGSRQPAVQDHQRLQYGSLSARGPPVECTMGTAAAAAGQGQGIAVVQRLSPRSQLNTPRSQLATPRALAAGFMTLRPVHLYKSHSTAYAMYSPLRGGLRALQKVVGGPGGGAGAEEHGEGCTEGGGTGELGVDSSAMSDCELLMGAFLSGQETMEKAGTAEEHGSNGALQQAGLLGVSQNGKVLRLPTEQAAGPANPAAAAAAATTLISTGMRVVGLVEQSGQLCGARLEQQSGQQHPEEQMQLQKDERGLTVPVGSHLASSEGKQHQHQQQQQVQSLNKSVNAAGGRAGQGGDGGRNAVSSIRPPQGSTAGMNKGQQQGICTLSSQQMISRSSTILQAASTSALAVACSSRRTSESRGVPGAVACTAATGSKDASRSRVARESSSGGQQLAGNASGEGYASGSSGAAADGGVVNGASAKQVLALCSATLRSHQQQHCQQQDLDGGAGPLVAQQQQQHCQQQQQHCQQQEQRRGSHATIQAAAMDLDGRAGPLVAQQQQQEPQGRRRRRWGEDGGESSISTTGGAAVAMGRCDQVMVLGREEQQLLQQHEQLKLLGALAAQADMLGSFLSTYSNPLSDDPPEHEAGILAAALYQPASAVAAGGCSSQQQGSWQQQQQFQEMQHGQQIHDQQQQQQQQQFQGMQHCQQIHSQQQQQEIELQQEMRMCAQVPVLGAAAAVADREVDDENGSDGQLHWNPLYDPHAMMGSPVTSCG